MSIHYSEDFPKWFHVDTFLHVHFSSLLSTWHFLGALKRNVSVFLLRYCMMLNVLYLHVQSSLHFTLWHQRVVRNHEWEKQRGREVGDVFVWEIAGGLRFTEAGLAKGRKDRFFKRLPTDSCSPIEPPLSATASYRYSPSDGRKIWILTQSYWFQTPGLLSIWLL